MIGLDTIVIVRYLAKDDVRQAAVATRLIEGSLAAEARGFVSIVTLAEVVWVMTSNYFSDAVVVELGREAGCAKTVTFDREAASHPGFEALR